MSSPSPHSFQNPVWQILEAVGWVLDRDPTQFGRIATKADWFGVATYKHGVLRGRDDNACRTLLHALQEGRLSAFKDGEVLARTFWMTTDIWAAAEVGVKVWREDMLSNWPDPQASEVAAVPEELVRAPESTVSTVTAKVGNTPSPSKYSAMLRPRHRRKTDAEKPKRSRRRQEAPRSPAASSEPTLRVPRGAPRHKRDLVKRALAALQQAKTLPVLPKQRDAAINDWLREQGLMPKGKIGRSTINRAAKEIPVQK